MAEGRAKKTQENYVKRSRGRPRTGLEKVDIGQNEPENGAESGKEGDEAGRWNFRRDTGNDSFYRLRMSNSESGLDHEPIGRLGASGAKKFEKVNHQNEAPGKEQKKSAYFILHTPRRGHSPPIGHLKRAERFGSHNEKCARVWKNNTFTNRYRGYAAAGRV